MRRIVVPAAVLWAVTSGFAAAAAETCDQAGCTGGGRCVAGCRGSWEDVKTKSAEYSIRCEYACRRAWDAWHAPDPDCRCTPPAGTTYVRKRLYKADGEERVERVPKYEVCVAPETRCGCASCARKPLCWWDPFGVLDRLVGW